LEPGAGIIHQVVLKTCVSRRNDDGIDPHTVNAGLGMVAIGVGGADAVDVMSGWHGN
jgi:aconitate hydratase